MNNILQNVVRPDYPFHNNLSFLSDAAKYSCMKEHLFKNIKGLSTLLYERHLEHLDNVYR